MATGLANSQALGESREAGERLLRQRLQQAGRYVKWVELGSQLITLVVGTLVFFLAAAFIDHWLISLGTVGRWLLLFALVAGWVWFSATRILPLLLRAVNPKYAAWAIEEATPSLKNSLLNFLLLKDDKTAVKESVLFALEQRAASDIAQVEVDSTIDRAPLIRVGYVLCGVLAVVALYKIASPKDPFQTAARVVAPWADLARPSRVLIRNVQPGHTSVYLGSVVEVTAEVQGARKSDEVRLVYSTADGQVQDRTVPMKAQAGGIYAASLPASNDGPAIKGPSSGLQQGVQYHIVAGDALSTVYEIRVRMKPTIAVERADLVFPPYMLKGSQTQDSGEIKALEGTRVTIHARANQPIKTAFLELDPRPGRSAETIPLAVDGQQATGSFTLQLKPDRVSPWRETYQVRFVNDQGEISEQPVLHKLEVLPDLPPEVEILAPQQSRVDLPEDSRLTIEARGIDPDFTLAELKVAGKRGDQQVFEQSLLPAGEPRSQASGKYEFVPAQLNLKAGDVVKYQARVADNRRDPLSGQPQPGRAQTSEYTIQIVPARKPNSNEAANNQPQPNDPHNQAAQANPDNKPPMPGANPPQKPDPQNPQQQNPMQPNPMQPMQGGNKQEGNNQQQNGGQGSSSKNEKNMGQSGQSEGNQSQPGQAQPGQGANKQEGQGQEGEPPPMPGQNPNGSGSGQTGTGQNQTGEGQNASDPSGAGGQASKQPGGQMNPTAGGRDPGSPDPTNANPNETGNPAGSPGAQTGNPGEENAQPGGNPQSGNNSGGGKPEHDGDKFEKLLQQLKEKAEAEKQKNQSGQNQPGQGNNQPGQTAPNDSPSGQSQNQPGGNQNQPGPNSQTGGKPMPAQPGAGKPENSKEADEQTLKDIEKMLAQERKKNGQPPMPGQGTETAQNDQGQPMGDQPNGAGQRGNPMQPQPGTNQPMPNGQQQPGASGQPMGEGPMKDPMGANQSGTPQNGAGQKPGEPTKSGSPQGPPRTDDGKQPTNGEGETKNPGAGQNGDPGAGSQSKDPTGSGQGQEANRDQPKDMSSGNDGQDSNDPSAPSTSKKQSNSKGGASGDQSGGGKQGAGQSGGQKGNDSAGGSSAGDEGSGAANEQGKGETGSKAGSGKPAAGKTGKSGSDPGQGSSTRPDQAGNEQGKNGDKSKDPNQPRGDKPAGKQGEGEGSTGGPSGGGGLPGDRSGAGITEHSDDVADAANLEYTRKVTDLVLQHLRDQAHNPDPDLAKKMQLTPQELQEFSRRWSQLKEEAARDPNKARELDEALRSLGMKAPSNRRRAGAGTNDKVRDLRDSGSRTQAPSKYREQFNQFRKSSVK